MGGIVGQEEDAHPIVTRWRQSEAQTLRLGSEEGVGQLHQHPRPVAAVRLRAARAAVAHVFEHRQCVGHDGVAAPPPDVGDEAHSAGIVLKAWIVEALLVRVAGVGRPLRRLGRLFVLLGTPHPFHFSSCS